MTKWSRRSEYNTALYHARKARRGGDIAAAERWLKLADRHVLVRSHFHANVDRLIRRDVEAAKRQREEAECEPAASPPMSRLDEILRDYRAGTGEFDESNH